MYEKYGENDGKTIRANCNLNIYFQTNDHDTAEAYSKMIGDYTIISKSISSKDKQDGNNENTSQTGIPLIKAADLMRLKDPYGIVMYAKENPAKIYMEYAYKCPNMINTKLEPLKQEINVIDFYKNHYFNLLNYNFWTLITTDDAISWKEVITEEEKHKVKQETDIKKLQAEETKIRDQIHTYENRDADSLTTTEKRELTRLRKKLVRVTNKLNNFSNQVD